MLLLDIDGLRWDVFKQALRQNAIPAIANLLDVPRHVQVPSVSTAPSITFCAQASLFTGEHPSRHGIPGNQFFDRFGRFSDGNPGFYAFDVGDTLEVDDAIRVFTHGLAASKLQVPTLYERLAKLGLSSVVATNMYATGAEWLAPSLVHLGRFLKGKNIFGMSSAAFDRATLNNVLTHVQANGLPNLLTVYFMGLDHDSHKKGPQAQLKALKVIDHFIAELWEVVSEHARGDVGIALFSDHGQIETIPDDQHSLQLGFPFDDALGSFFKALQLDVHDYPGEAPHCDAVAALNGGTAAVYLHNKVGHWWDTPEFKRDVLPIGQAFWEAHANGQYTHELQHALAGVLVRNVEQAGWDAPYQALTPKGEVLPLNVWFKQQPEGLYLDPVNRLDNYVHDLCGDLLLISHYAAGYYFGKPLTGMHGGLHPEDSRGVLAYGWQGTPPANWQRRVEAEISQRCRRERRRLPSVADMILGVEVLLGLPSRYP